MGRFYLRNIAKETIAITSEGGYKCNGEYIELVGEDFSSVEVLSPERLEEIEEDEDEFFERAFCASKECHIKVKALSQQMVDF